MLSDCKQSLVLRTGPERAAGVQCAPKEAAVLVPLFEDEEGTVRVVLTERSHMLSTHAGEVAFPGGKRDPEDVTIRDTALREAHEEVRKYEACCHFVYMFITSSERSWMRKARYRSSVSHRISVRQCFIAWVQSNLDEALKGS